MNYDRFIQTLTDDLPPKGITDLLTALWWEKKGDWHKAHIITQEIHTNNASLIHAYLHRREGDLSNANYWYRRANQLPSQNTLRDEAEEIIRFITQI